MELVHEKLRSYFKEIGMSQVEIAEKLGVSKTTVNNLLTGYSKFGNAQAEKWSELFGISKSFLLTGEGSITEEENSKNEERIASLTSTIHILTETIQEKDKTIDALKARIAELEKKIV